MAKAKYKQGSDGVYRARIWDGTYNQDGSKHRKNLRSTKSSADLEKQVNELKRLVKEGLSVQSTDRTFLHYAREWKKTYKSIRSDNTQAMYDNIIEKHLIALDKLKLQDTRKQHFQLVINNASNKTRTCQQIEMTFKQIIKSAIQDKYLPAQAYADICIGADIPKYKSSEKRALLPAEVTALKNADFSPMERAFVYTIYGCGLRRGEVLALRKHLDIDIKKAQITVRRAVTFKGNNPIFKDPKSHNGFRTVPMPPYLVEHLKTYMTEIPGDYPLCLRDGSPMTKSSYRKMWEQIEKKMNLAAGGTEKLQVVYGFTAHTFRHDFCTNLCYQIPKISIRKIAQLMGDTEAVVLKVYNHIMDEKEDAASVINDARAL